MPAVAIACPKMFEICVCCCDGSGKNPGLMDRFRIRQMPIKLAVSWTDGISRIKLYTGMAI